MMEPPPTAEQKKGVINEPVQYMTNGLTYAWTISPDPKRWYNFPNARQQYIEVLPYIFKAYKNIGDLTIYPELNKKGYIHFHGYLTCKDRIKHAKTKASITESIGFECIKEIDNPQKWKEYVVKDSDIMNDVLKGLCPFPITNESWKRWQSRSKDERKAIKDEGKKRGIMDLLNAGKPFRARLTFSD